MTDVERVAQIDAAIRRAANEFYDYIWNEALDAAIISINKEARGHGPPWPLDVVRRLKRGGQADRPDHSGEPAEPIQPPPEGQERAIPLVGRHAASISTRHVRLIRNCMQSPHPQHDPLRVEHRSAYFDQLLGKTRCWDCQALIEIEAERRLTEACHGQRDGDCAWIKCPQLADGEPYKTGRCCPLTKVDR